MHHNIHAFHNQWQIIATLKKANNSRSMIMKCMNYMMHFHTRSMKLKPVHITASDYEMHELYDAFSYSNNNFALNDLILILSTIISVWHHKSNPILFNHKMGFTNLLYYNILL